MKKVKNIGILLILMMLIMLVFSGCSKESVDTSKINIVTSFYPMYIATANIVDDVEDVELRNLTAATTGCLHDYQLTTANMITLSTADILVINGSGMEGFIEKAVSTYESLKVVDASKGIIENHNHIEDENLNSNHEHDEKHEQNVIQKVDIEKIAEHNHNHNHGENAHIWVSISMHIEQVENIKNELIKINPENAEKYIKNANNYISKLEELKKKMHESIDNVANKKIVTFHEAFEFFAEEFGLEIVSVIEREPGTYPSAGEVADIIDLVRSKEVKAIFVEPQYSRSAADTIARETGVSVYTLDPIVTGELNKNAYIELMNSNLEALKEALK